MKIGNIPAGSVPVVQPKQAGSDVSAKQEIREDVQPTVVKEPAKAEEGEDGSAEDELMRKSVDQANKTLEIYNKFIERKVHEKTHTIMYTLKDTKTNEVIAEFPPKKIQDMIAKMWELAGLFVDEKA